MKIRRVIQCLEYCLALLVNIVMVKPALPVAKEATACDIGLEGSPALISTE